MRYIAILTLIWCFSCSSDDNVTPPPKVNSAPETFGIDDITFDGKATTIDWADAQDDDGDQIFYKLYVNSILVSETTESIGATTVEYNTDYIGRVIATDKKGGTTELNFQFSSPQSKILLFTDGFGNLKAYDLYTRQLLWNAPTSFIETHTIYENVVYTGQNGINALDILTGENLWQSDPSPFHNEYRSILADEVNVYAFDSDSDLLCVDRITGGKLWSRSFLNYYAPLTMDSDRVFVSSRNDDNLYAINKKTGLTDWSFEVDPNGTGAADRIESNPLIVGDNIYFGDNIGRFYSVNKNTGIKNWSINAPQFNGFSPSPTQYEQQIITGTRGYQGDLYSFDINTGSEKWKYTAQQTSFSTSPFVYKDKIYIGATGNGSGELICLDAKDGQLIWKFDLDNETTSSPIVFEDLVYIADWDGNMFAVNALTGVLDWKIKIDDVIFKSPTIVVGESQTIIYPSIHGLKH